MKKPLLILFGILCLVLIGVAAWKNPHEPAIQGKSTSLWIQSLTNRAVQSTEVEQALRKIGLPALPYLVTAFEKKDSFAVKSYAKILANAPAIVRKFLPKPFPWESIRSTVAEIIGYVGQGHRFSDGAGDAPTTPELQRAVLALARTLTTNDNIRIVSAQALAFIGPNARDAVPALSKMFDQGNSHEKVMVCQAFGTMGPCSFGDQMARVLAGALQAPDKDLNISAAQALQGIGPHAAMAVPLLIERLKDDNEQMRQSSLRALAKIGHLPSSLRPKLTSLLSETNDFTRAGAAVALLRLDPQDILAAQIVRDCLRMNKAANVRSSTVFLLEGTGPTARVFFPELRELANDSDPNVGTFARKVLRQIAPATAPRTVGSN